MDGGQSSLYLPPDTYRVSVLAEELKSVLQQTYSGIWIAGEIQRFHISRPGHAYFELVEKGRDDRILARVAAVAFRGDLERIRRRLQQSELALSEGQEIRCRCNLDFYPPNGKLQVVLHDVDPVFSLGSVARRRQEVLRDLRDRGLLERNGELEVGEVPLRVGLVTSADSAAYHDFMTTLAESGYGFQVLLASATVQGHSSESEVRHALSSLARVRGLDCVALVRGGGARADLVAFDSRSVSETICRMPLPVLTGLGHEIDRSVADLAAHSSFKTPTSAAEFLVQRVAGSERRLTLLGEALVQRSRARLDHAARAVDHGAERMKLARSRIASDAVRLEGLEARLAAAATRELGRSGARQRNAVARLAAMSPQRLSSAETRRRAALQRLVDLSRGRQRVAEARVEVLARLVRELSPSRTLERGFSITRGTDGRVLRSARAAAVGGAIETELAEGRLSSRIVGIVPGESA